jgi:hypothetical protein
MSDGEIPTLYFVVLIATIIAMASTYFMILNKSRKHQLILWSWVHTYNSLVLFANAWSCTIYWNQPVSSKLLFRVCNAPTFAIVLNFIATDWLLLTQHSALAAGIFLLFEILHL